MQTAPAITVSAIALSTLAAPALGAIIEPIRDLKPGGPKPGAFEEAAVTAPVAGPIGAIELGDWYTFSVAELATFTLEVRRQNLNLDPAIFVFQGDPTGLDTDVEFASGNPATPASLVFLGQADNEIPVAGGPNGDPRFSFTTPIGGAGVYSAVVVFTPDTIEGDRNFPYTIEVEGALPAPGTAMLLLAPIAMRRKR